MPLCTKCKIEKPSEQFCKDKRRTEGLCSWCRSCSKSATKVYKATKHGKERVWEYRIKNEYGITREDYNTLFDKQNGCCAICGKHQSELPSKLYVDHIHSTMEIRGLLCMHCNCLLGNARDNINILQNSIQYLNNFNK